MGYKLTGTPAVDEFAQEHKHLFSTTFLASTTNSRDDSPPLDSPAFPEPEPSNNGFESDSAASGAGTPVTGSGSGSNDVPEPFESAPLWGAAILSSSERDPGSGRNTPVQEMGHHRSSSNSSAKNQLPHLPQHQHQHQHQKKKKALSRFSLANFLPSAIGGARGEEGEEEYLHEGDLVLGDKLKFLEAETSGNGDRKVEEQLGPWRFGEDGVDALEVSFFFV